LHFVLFLLHDTSCDAKERVQSSNREGKTVAQVFERKGKWYARFMHKGKDYCRSTGIVVATRSKKAANESKDKAEAQLARMLAEIRGRESVDALFSRLTQAVDHLPEIEREPKRIMLSEQLRRGIADRLPVADAWEAWLHSPRKRMPRAVTIDGYHAYWGRDEIKKHGRQSQHGFKNWLATQHQEVTFLHEISPAIAEEYATHLWRSGISPRTYNGFIKFLRGMFKVLQTRGGLVNNVWEDIPSQENNTEGRRNLTPEELTKVCSKAEGDLRLVGPRKTVP